MTSTLAFALQPRLSFLLTKLSSTSLLALEINWLFADCFRLHGVCKENPLAPLIGRLGLPLYRTSGDNSVLYDHDLERFVFQALLSSYLSHASFS